MTVYVRILLYIVAGWMLSSGLISKEVERIITTDPVIATGVQALLGSAVALATGYWWKLAKRFGWQT